MAATPPLLTKIPVQLTEGQHLIANVVDTAKRVGIDQARSLVTQKIGQLRSRINALPKGPAGDAMAISLGTCIDELYKLERKMWKMRGGDETGI